VSAVPPGAARPSVVYVAPDKMGGMMNIIAHLLKYRRPDGLDYHAVLTHNTYVNEDARFSEPLVADSQTVVEYRMPVENLHAIMRRLARAMKSGPGVVVAGDLLDLATLSTHDLGRAVVLILHGDTDYYYDLAVKHDAVVHAFVAYSRRMYERLLERLPHRAASILHLPYGIPLPADVRKPSRGPLRLIFVGRLAHGQKGVLDLPLIDRTLADRSVDVQWTIVGAGPDDMRLKGAWPATDRVRYLGPMANADVLAELPRHDLFVLPTRAEGFAVALLEAMACGLVPVVSAIESGVPEVVQDGVSGFTPAVQDVAGFADAIETLDRGRERLEAMSQSAARNTRARYDIHQRVDGYQELYSRYAELYRPLSAQARLQYGSRLDRPWIPNSIVQAVRSAIRAAR
jgi:glycosyltransferase involved in cell wall biosynthesis